jgi:hypothetical protein
MRQSQSGFVDPAHVSGRAPASRSELEEAVSFQFIVTWSSLLPAADPPKPITQAFPLVHAGERPRPTPAPAPRVMPSPQPSSQALSLTASARTYADEAVPGAAKKTRSALGVQWEMVVPKMVRTAKRVAPLNARPTQAGALASADAVFAEQSTPNLYTAASSFGKSVSLKLCIGVVALAAISVPLWKHAARPAAAEIETSIAGGDWLREAAVAGDPGVKRSRQLVVYRPAFKAADYRFEFDWTVDSGDVGLVFRAKDLGNYYAVRLKVLKAGSSPTFAAEYFSVYHFVESPHNEKVMVFSKSDPVVHVRMDVFGPMFTLYLQKNATEYWTDGQLPSGALGFFEEWNRSPEVRAVRMSFPQRSEVFHAPPAPGLRQFLAMYQPRALAGARDQAFGGV